MATKDSNTKPSNLPCPFCGIHNMFIQNRNGEEEFGPYYVECLDCNATGPDSIYQLTALNNWNRRA